MFPQNPQTHEKRDTVPNTAHGTDYQVHSSMAYAFLHAYIHNRSFTISTENIEYGAFDDLIFTSDEGVMALQFKHRLAPENTGGNLSDFVTASGNKHELMLYKYFDSICHKLHNLSENITFHLVTNERYPRQFVPVLEDNTGAFKQDFFQYSDPFLHGLLVASIVKHSQFLSKPLAAIDIPPHYMAYFLQTLIARGHDELYGLGQLKEKIHQFILSTFSPSGKRFNDEKRENLRNSYLERISQRQINLNPEATNALKNILISSHVSGFSLYEIAAVEGYKISPEYQYIKSFLMRIRFSLNGKNLNDVKQDVELKIRQQFNLNHDALYHAFFHQFYEWLIAREGVVYTSDQVKQFFDGWYNQYVISERLAGITQQKLQHDVREKGKLVALERGAELQALETFSASNEKNILFLTGEAGIGKSTLVRNFFETKPPVNGHYFFLDAEDLAEYLRANENLLNVFALKNTKILFIDNAEVLLRRLEDKNIILNKLFASGTTLPFKVVFLSRKEGFSELSQDLERRNFLFSVLELQPFSLEYIYQKYTRLPGLFNNEGTENVTPLTRLLTIPFYLNLIVTFQAQLANIDLQQLQLNNNIKEYLIRLAIEGQPASLRTFETTKISKERKKIIRVLAYETGKSSSQWVTKPPESTALNELIRDGILVVQDNKIKFSHNLYLEWAVNFVTDREIQCYVEAMDKNPLRFFHILMRRMPNHMVIFASRIQSHIGFRESLRKSMKHKFHGDLKNIENIAVMQFNSKGKSALDLLLKILYAITPKDPSASVRFFSKINWQEDEDVQKSLRDNDQIIEILDRIIHYPETFDYAADILCAITSDMGREEKGNIHCNIQYRLTNVFLPYKVRVSFDQRITYLERNTREKERNLSTLAWTLCFVLNHYSGETFEHLGSSIDDGNPTAGKYELPEEDVFQGYLDKILTLLNRVYYFNNCEERYDIINSLSEYILKNIGNCLFVYPKIAILRILRETNIAKCNDGEVKGEIEKLYRRTQAGDFSMLESYAQNPEDSNAFKKRIELFYNAMQQGLTQKRSIDQVTYKGIVPNKFLFLPGPSAAPATAPAVEAGPSSSATTSSITPPSFVP